MCATAPDRICAAHGAPIVSLTISVFAREKRSKCLDFILTKPRSRKKIFAYKLSSVISILIGMNIIFVAASLVSYSSSGGSNNYFLLASCSLFFTQLVFVALALLVSVFFRRIRSVSGTAAALGFGAFIMSAMTSIMGGKIVFYFAPLKFFDASKLIFEGGYDGSMVIWAVFVVLTCVAASYLRFTKSDAHAV